MGEKRTFVGESSELVKKFFEKYPPEPGSVIFSDKGNSFFPKGESILRDVGFALHEAYPPPVHQFLSPNDNHLHGAAKKVWKESISDFQDDVEASIRLLSLIDEQTETHAAHWFERNFLDLKKEDALDLVGTLPLHKAQKTKKRLERYRTFLRDGKYQEEEN